MDDNVRDVILALLTVGGTLAGVWAGSAFQDRRRHDAEKRRAYAAFAVGMRQVILQMDRNRDSNNPAEVAEIEDQLGFAIAENEGLIRMIAGKKVAAKAVAVVKAFGMLVDTPGTARSEAWKAAEWNARRSIDDFLKEARHDLG